MMEDDEKYDMKASPYLWLFLDLFLCRIEQGSLADFQKHLSNSIAISTKYRFLNSMVHYGAFKMTGKEPWGLGSIRTYRLDKNRLYNIFIETPFGKKLRQVFDEHSLMFDGF